MPGTDLVTAVVMKNCEPFESGPALAMPVVGYDVWSAFRGTKQEWRKTIKHELEKEKHTEKTRAGMSNLEVLIGETVAVYGFATGT